MLTTVLDHTLTPQLEADSGNTVSPHSFDTLGNGNGERRNLKPKPLPRNKLKVGLERDIQIIPEGLKQPLPTSGLGEVFLWTDCLHLYTNFLHLSLVHLMYTKFTAHLTQTVHNNKLKNHVVPSAVSHSPKGSR